MRTTASGTRDPAPLSPTLTRIQSHLGVLGDFYQALYDDSQAEFEKAVAADDCYSRGMYRGRVALVWMILKDLAALNDEIKGSESEGGTA
nr:hypothetical protein [Zoogloeaceae bacterium]